MVVDGGDVDGSGVAADDDVGRLLELKWKVECPARSLHQDADEFRLTNGEEITGFRALVVLNSKAWPGQRKHPSHTGSSDRCRL